MSIKPDQPPITPPAKTAAPVKPLPVLPRDELVNLAEDLGIDSTEYKALEALQAAVQTRRELIAAMDRDAMLDVVRWGRYPVPENASKDQIAGVIARIKSMRFVGLTERGLLVLAVIRNVRLRGDETENGLIRKLKRQEGFVRRIARKRRAWLGSIVSSMLGEDQDPADYKFLPPQAGPGAAAPKKPAASPAADRSFTDEIEDVGLFGGLASRVKRTADSYLNQKLDEIELRIDRKLDEIDKRLAEWRDKEIANRLRIIKITLWASVIVAIISLVYLYVKVYFVR